MLETVVATEKFDAGAAAAAATDVLELTVSPLIVATTGATGEADCRTTVWGLVPTDSEATIWLFAEVAETFFEDVVSPLAVERIAAKRAALKTKLDNIGATFMFQSSSKLAGRCYDLALAVGGDQISCVYTG